MDKLKWMLAKIIKKLLQPPAIRCTNIHSTSKVCSGSNIVECDIDRYSYIGNNCSVIHTKIGSFCSIADNCYIGGAAHPIEWVSTSPVFHQGKNIMHKNFSTYKFQTFNQTIIGNDVWVGSNSLIKSGVKIGDGAIIGMGSVVTKDIDPYAIVAGNPAKLIRYRFNEYQRGLLSKSCWWEKTDAELSQMSKYMNNVDYFLEYFWRE